MISFLFSSKEILGDFIFLIELNEVQLQIIANSGIICTKYDCLKTRLYLYHTR